ncbi:MAG: lytic murein transglycosylase [Candidatus Pacebacteria bacterium]|jgi:membrane-bound lytic murein transglycosylase B|nr:lytic murein transglycosylase [Candidatus Paceibacterota bacterium]
MLVKAISRKKIIDVKNVHSFERPLKEPQGVSKKNVRKVISGIHWQQLVSLAVFIIFVAVTLQTEVLAPISLYPQPMPVVALYDEEKAQLEKELEAVEAQIAAYEKMLSQTKTQKASLQNKINELKKKAEQLNLQIKAINLNLQTLSIRINETERSIAQTIEKLENTKKVLADCLRSLYQLKQKSPVEIILTNNKISDYFDYTAAIAAMQDKIQENINEMEELRSALAQQKEKLNINKEEQQKLLALQLLQKQTLDKTSKEQANLLEITKGNEQTYQQMLNTSRQKANAIRQRIYELIGVQTQVTFGEALNIADWVASRVNIRPAFLLAVITQESNLGKNVGTCNRPNDPLEKSWRTVMHPTRDQPVFKQITQELGLDPDTTPISCPMYKNGQRIGWGGAMGPAQFIPSTWLKYKNRVSQITGKSPANPWDIRDSFVAAALYLNDFGAGKKTRDAEWRAAMYYFSGSTNPAYSFYGNNVLAIADRYEADIAALRQVAAK